VAPPRVDFYVSEEAGDGARLGLACRVIEKAYLAKQQVVVWSDDAATLTRLDELLWTLGETSFVPHESIAQEGAACAAPVVLTTGPLPAGSPDVLISLGARVSPAFEKFTRVAEFLDARPEVRAAGRERFKAYRDKAIEPTTHKV
jgi:DNA polymerase III subunit chi